MSATTTTTTNNNNQQPPHDAFTEFIHTLQYIISVVVEYTWYLIREIFYIILDIIGLAFMLASCICPSRTFISPYVYFYALFVPLKSNKNYFYSQEELQQMSLYKKVGKHRGGAIWSGFVSFCLAILDIFLVVAAVFSICVPTRTLPFLKEMYLAMTCKRKLDEDIEIKHSYNVLLRLTVARNFGRALIDIFGIFLFVLSLFLSPWFAIAYFRSVYPIFFTFTYQYYSLKKLDRNEVKNLYKNECTTYGKFQFFRSLHFCRMAFVFAGNSIGDTFSALPCFIVSLIAPHRILFILFDTIKEIIHINSDKCQILNPINERSYDYELHNNEDNESVEMKHSRINFRFICLFNCFGSIIDIFAIPLGLIGLFCGMHGKQLTRELVEAFRSGTRREAQDFVRKRVDFGILQPYYYCKYQGNKIYVHRSYNVQARKAAIYFGLFSLLDILAVPFLIITCAFVIRVRILYNHYKRIQNIRKIIPKENRTRIPTQLVGQEENHFGEDALRSHPVNVEDNKYDGYAFEKYYMYETREQIIKQGFLTIIDIVFVPAILLILVTWYRFQNVSKEMKHDFNWKTKKLVLTNFILIILDIIFLPLLIIVCLTCYRNGLLKDLINKQGENKFNCKETMERHIFLIVSLVLIILDIIMLPFQLLLVVTIWRSEPIINSFKNHGFSFEDSMERYISTILNVVLLIIDIMTLPFTLMLLLSIYRFGPVYHLYFAKNELYHLECRKSCTRVFQVFLHFFHFLIDLLSLPFILIICVSTYRGEDLRKNFRNLIQYLRRFSTAKKMEDAQIPVIAVNTNDNDNRGDNNNTIAVAPAAKVVDEHIAQNDWTDLQRQGYEYEQQEQHREQEQEMYLSFVGPSDFYYVNSNNRVRIVIITTLLILLDLLVLPFVGFVFVFHHRWKFVTDAAIAPPPAPPHVADIRVQNEDNNNNNNNNGSIQNNNYTKRSSTSYHCIVLFQFILCISDIFVGIVGLVVVITIFRADIIFQILRNGNASFAKKKKLIGMEFLKLIRDMVVAPFFLVIAFTLYRLPSCILSFMSSASQPVTEIGKVKMNRLEMHIPKIKGVIEFHLHGVTNTNIRNTVDFCNQFQVTQMRILGKGKFWENIEEIFGGLVVQIAKSVQPLKVTCDIMDPKHEPPKGHEILIVVKTTHKAHVKNVKKHLASLMLKSSTTKPNETTSAQDIHDIFDIMLQVEGTTMDKKKKTINICNAKLPLIDLYDVVDNAFTVGSDAIYNTNIVEEDMTQEKLLPFWNKGPGFRDSMWHIVLLCIFNIIVDLLHLTCLLLSVLMPWRFFHAIWLMNLSSKHNVVEETKYFLQEIYDIDITLHNHMEYMYAFINESGKSSNTKLHWAKTIDTALRRKSQKSLNEFHRKLSALIKNLNENNSYVDDIKFKSLCKQFEQEAIRKSQLPVIHANVNLSVQECIYDQEYEGPMMLELNNAERIKADTNLEQTLKKLTKRFNELLHDANHPPLNGGSAYKSGIWRRKEQDLRKYCLTALKYAIMDVLTIVLLMIIIFTMYRFPNFISRVLKETKRGGLNSKRLRLVLRMELVEMCYDMWNIMQFIILFTLVAITLIRLPRLIGDIPSFQSLTEAVEVAEIHLSHSLREIWQLFSLLFIWETYVVIIRVIFYAIFVPAASFATLLHLLFRKVLGTTPRFLLSGGLWLTCLIIPIITLQGDNVFFPDANTRINSFIAILVIIFGIIAFNVGFHFTNKQRQEFSERTWRSPIVRLTLPNVISLIHIFFAPFQMLLAFALLITKTTVGMTTYGYFPKGIITTFLFLSNTRNVLDNDLCRTKGLFAYDERMIYPPTGTIIALFLIVAWIYLVTVPLAIKDHEKRKRVQESSGYRNIASWIYEFCYISICANLLQPALLGDPTKSTSTSSNINITEYIYIPIDNATSNSSIPSTPSQPDYTGRIPAKDLLTCVIIGMVYLLFTTLAESTRNRGAQETVRAETTDVGHDIQYTELYNLMSHVLSTIFLFLCLIFHNGEGDDINVVAIGAIIIFAVIVIWNLCYFAVFHRNPSSVPWIVPLHSASSLIGLCGCIFMYIDKGITGDGEDDNGKNYLIPWLISSIIIMMIAIVVALKLRYDAVEERKAFKRRSGLTQSLRHLFTLETKLLLDDDLTTFKSKRKSKSRKYLLKINTPVFLAKAVLKLERKILCENYRSSFVYDLSALNELEKWRNSLDEPEIDFPTISNHIVQLTNNLKPPHYTQLIRKIIEDAFHSHEMYNYDGLVMFTILGFLYGDNVKQYDHIQHRYYTYLTHNRKLDANYHDDAYRLIPRKIFFTASRYEKWMKAFDLKAKMYWENQKEEKENRSLISGLMNVINAGKRLLFGSGQRHFVMSREEFLNLDGAPCTDPDVFPRRYNPYFTASYQLYQSIMRRTAKLKADGNLLVDSDEITRVSIKYCFDQIREYNSEHDSLQIFSNEIEDNIQNGKYHSRSHLQVNDGSEVKVEV